MVYQRLDTSLGSNVFRLETYVFSTGPKHTLKATRANGYILSVKLSFGVYNAEYDDLVHCKSFDTFQDR